MNIRAGFEQDFRSYVNGKGFPRQWCTTSPCGLVAEDDGEIVAVAMVTLDEQGRAWVWFHQKKPLAAAQLHRYALKLLDLVRSYGKTVHAFCDEGIPGAERWFRHLGFEPSGQAMHPSGTEKTVWVRA